MTTQTIESLAKAPAADAPLDSRRRSPIAGLRRSLTALGPYANLAEIAALAVLAFFVLRVVLLVSFAQVRQLGLAERLGVLWVGLRFDLLAALGLALPQALHLALLPSGWLAHRWTRWLAECQWLVAFLFLPWICVTEYLFFDEFQSRLNYIAFEYLAYPTEVCCNVWQSYPVWQLLLLVGVVGGSLHLVVRERFLRRLQAAVSWQRRCGLVAATMAALVALGLTTGMQSICLTENRIANECAGNGLYSFAYYAWTCRFDFDSLYVTIDDEEARQRLRRRVVQPGDLPCEGSAHPLDRVVTSSRPQRDWNVVVVLEESFGSNFVGVLGHKKLKLTPCFDALTAEGVLFDNFYATGNRTARALEAVLTTLPPIPTESILKRDHSRNVYTLATVLSERGYERLFMTGGRGTFDGVRSFMTANGFNRFLELSDYQDPVFTNAWGVSDEDLFHRALEEFDELHETGQPFFAVLLTVSNHLPFTYPSGRIAERAPLREHAVKYADWALGDFFSQARQHAFWPNTMFVVLGDHGARVYGSQMFPMRSYRVPLLMILPDGELRGTRCHTLACSLDVAPTILGRLGGSYRSVFFGRDALELDPARGYALMQHNHDLALLDSQQPHGGAGGSQAGSRL